MVNGDLAAAATANFVVHAIFASSRRPEARVHVGPDLVVADAGFEVDTFNVVCAARLHGAGVAETVRRVAAGFGERPFSWWVAPGDEPGDLGSRLEAGGLVASESALAMSAPLGKGLLGSMTIPPGLRLERVSSAAQLASFARVNAENWDPPDPAVETFFGRSAGDLLSRESPHRFYLALADGGDEAAAAVELTVAAGVVGVYNLSTRAVHRGRGIASALLARSLSEAVSDGASRACLQAAESGAGLYRRLGFETFGVITEYKPLRRSS